MKPWWAVVLRKLQGMAMGVTLSEGRKPWGIEIREVFPKIPALRALARRGCHFGPGLPVTPCEWLIQVQFAVPTPFLPLAVSDSLR